ncbi:MAG: glycogen/starch synthase, partial [Acholeplasmatales bacterium]|nr:glycogen/starch synthase [Acholeplasmatales bacterium]
MKVLFCTSEIYPFSKTGGLGDVSYSLPKELVKKGVNVKVITPLYSGKINYSSFEYLASASVDILGRHRIVDYYKYLHEGVEIIFVKNDELFYRDNIYGEGDDGERFIFFCYSILEG